MSAHVARTPARKAPFRFEGVIDTLDLGHSAPNVNHFSGIPKPNKTGVGGEVISQETASSDVIPGASGAVAPRDSVIIRYTSTAKPGDCDEKPHALEIQIPREDWTAFVKECLETLRGFVQRNTDMRRTQFRYSDLELDLLKRTAVRAGHPLHLSKKEFDILEYFMRRPQRVLTKDQIFEHVWGLIEEDHSNCLEVHLSQLRRKLKGDSQRELIQTVRGVGYVLTEEAV